MIRILTSVSFLMLILLGIFSKRGWLDYRRIHTQLKEIDLKIASAQSQRDQLIDQIRKVQTSPHEQERLVRSVLGYIRPDEFVVEFP